MINKLRAIYIFAKTVELGSFRATARALDLSPSVVSYHISQLEKQFDVALLYRSTRKLSLTDQGKKLFTSAKNMIDAAQKGLDVLSGKGTEPFGKLTISVPAALSRGLLINDIAQFAALNQKIELEINFTDRNQDLISQGIDVAIRVGILPDSSLKSRKITVIDRKLVATPSYLASRPKPKSPNEISSWEWVRFSIIAGSREFTNTRGNKIKVNFGSRIVVDNADALCQFIKASLGLGTPPTFLIEDDIKAGNLVEVLPNWKMEPLPVYAVWPNNAPRSSLTNYFVTYLVKQQSNVIHSV